MLPIVQPRYRQASADESRQQAEALRERAQNLAAQLTADEAVDLLTLIDPHTASTQQFDCLAAFARAAGRNAPDPQPVLGRLLEGPFTAAAFLLSGLLQAWPQECFGWLSANITTRHVAELSLWIADELSPGQETALLDAIASQLAEAPTTSTDAAGRQRGDGDTHGPGDDHPGLPGSDLAALTARVADHLGWCRAQPAGRLNRLVALSKTAPDEVLPRLFAAVESGSSSSPSGTHALDGEDGSALPPGTGQAFLARALAGADSILDADLDYDTAAAAEALGRAAPAETAQLLTDRTLSTALPVILCSPGTELLLQQLS